MKIIEATTNSNSTKRVIVGESLSSLQQKPERMTQVQEKYLTLIRSET